jgi:uncharacterized RDD family membrane protein YckC
MPYASRASRLLGQIIDGLVAVAPIFLIALGLVDDGLDEGSASRTLIALGLVAWMFFHILLADGMEGGQSWGKRVVGTRVVDAATGAPCTFWQAFVRNVLLSLLGPIDWLFIFGERHQRLGDKAAGTLVVPAS